MGGAAARPKLGGRLTAILDLPERIAALSPEARGRVLRLFAIRPIAGRTDPPPEMAAWLTAQFGSVDAVRDQRLISITNRATGESALLAPLRHRRPMDGAGHAGELRAAIDATRDDPFCHPLTGTPADTWGRVRGRRMISGANAALADRHHAVLVFDDHDPLAFDADLVDDLLATGRAWADRAHAEDPTATHYTLLWNCLWRAGGSIIHGHGQALLADGDAYGRLEAFRAAAERHAAAGDRSLADDLVTTHRDLGLAVDGDDGVTTFAHLTPVKDREVLVVGTVGMDERHPAFSTAVAAAVLAFRDRLDVVSFNLVLWRPPLVATPGWETVPPIARLVDRGDPFARPSDIGAMELYGTPIVGTDPYEVVDALRRG
ncbi:MAG TPA: hypothetical protein VF367_10410 [Candidatus Limnocylindria bacterium]